MPGSRIYDGRLIEGLRLHTPAGTHQFDELVFRNAIDPLLSDPQHRALLETEFGGHATMSPAVAVMVARGEACRHGPLDGGSFCRCNDLTGVGYLPRTSTFVIDPAPRYRPVRSSGRSALQNARRAVPTGDLRARRSGGASRASSGIPGPGMHRLALR